MVADCEVAKRVEVVTGARLAEVKSAEAEMAEVARGEGNSVVEMLAVEDWEEA